MDPWSIHQRPEEVRLRGLMVYGSVIYMCAQSLSHVQLFMAPWTVALQAPLFMAFPRQECWSGLPFPSPGDLPSPGMEPASLVSCIVGRFFTTSATWEALSKSHTVMSGALRPHRLHSSLNSPGQDTGVGSPSLLQQIFPTQESNQGLLHCRRILCQLRYQGSPISDIFSLYLPSSPFKV